MKELCGTCSHDREKGKATMTNALRRAGVWMISCGMGMIVACSVASAAFLTECGPFDDVAYIPEPIAENIRSFADGKVRVTNAYTFGEPVSGPARGIINIFYEGDYICKQLSSREDGTGFAWVYPDRAIYISNENEDTYLFVPVKPYAYAGEKPDHRIEFIRLKVKLDGTPSIVLEK